MLQHWKDFTEVTFFFYDDAARTVKNEQRSVCSWVGNDQKLGCGLETNGG